MALYITPSFIMVHVLVTIGENIMQQYPHDSDGEGGENNEHTVLRVQKSFRRKKNHS